MKVTLIWVGKRSESYFEEAISEYAKRLGRYLPFQVISIPDLKGGAKMDIETQKQREGAQILAALRPADDLVLWDEGGEAFTSAGLADWLSSKMVSGTRNLVFCIGGPYGFSSDVYRRAGTKLSLSRLTFSHQMVRVIALEQLYRAMTILKGEPYHHA
ncbi:MAG: 23S rRNA (pseudouridine(1915)-N(3))-methyltransferase RlmH [Bacteroidales bacterium]